MSAELDFDEFYQAAFHRVVGQVYTMTGSLAEAEDSVQEAFARAWQRWNEVGGYGDAEAWVRSVAFRISVSAWRKAVNRFSAHKRSHQDGELSGLSPDRLAIVAALRRIPAEQRQVIVLHHLLDRPVEEIAREVGAPVGTVKARLARGRRALAPHLSEFAADGEGPVVGMGGVSGVAGAGGVSGAGGVAGASYVSGVACVGGVPGRVPAARAARQVQSGRPAKEGSTDV